MYLDFAHQAVADRFEEIRRDEMGHRDAFQAALKKLESKPAGNY